MQSKPKTVVEATSILPSLNGKTARSRRAIVPLTHLARQGRVTVTIGRRELLAALGGAAAAWPVAARDAAMAAFVRPWRYESRQPRVNRAETISMAPSGTSYG